MITHVGDVPGAGPVVAVVEAGPPRVEVEVGAVELVEEVADVKEGE